MLHDVSLLSHALEISEPVFRLLVSATRNIAGDPRLMVRKALN